MLYGILGVRLIALSDYYNAGNNVMCVLLWGFEMHPISQGSWY